MPRYHFNVYNGSASLDARGSELPDWHAARREAIRLSGALLADDHDRLAPGADWRMDDTGLLFRLDFTIIESPAVCQS